MNLSYRTWCCSIREVLRIAGYRMVANRAFPNWPQVREYWRREGTPPPLMARRLIDAGMARKGG